MKSHVTRLPPLVMTDASIFAGLRYLLDDGIDDMLTVVSSACMRLAPFRDPDHCFRPFSDDVVQVCVLHGLVLRLRLHFLVYACEVAGIRIPHSACGPSSRCGRVCATVAASS